MRSKVKALTKRISRVLRVALLCWFALALAVGQVSPAMARGVLPSAAPNGLLSVSQGIQDPVSEWVATILIKMAKEYAEQAVRRQVSRFVDPYLQKFGLMPNPGDAPLPIVQLSEASLAEIRKIVGEESWAAVQRGIDTEQVNEASEKLGQLDLLIRGFTADISAHAPGSPEYIEIAKSQLRPLDEVSAELVSMSAFRPTDPQGQRTTNFRNAQMFMLAASMRLSVLTSYELLLGRPPEFREQEAGRYVKQLQDLYQSFYDWHRQRFKYPVECPTKRCNLGTGGQKCQDITGVGFSVDSEIGMCDDPNNKTGPLKPMYRIMDDQFYLLKQSFFAEAQLIYNSWSEIAKITPWRWEPVEGPPDWGNRGVILVGDQLETPPSGISLRLNGNYVNQWGPLPSGWQWDGVVVIIQAGIYRIGHLGPKLRTFDIPMTVKAEGGTVVIGK